MNNEVNTQVKSKERVKDFGEVFTNPREVNAMLDLVKDESYKVDSRFLEPACGNGNFLVEILNRKMKSVKQQSDSKADWGKLTILAVSNIYGIDIQEDNCQESKERLLSIIEEEHYQMYHDSINEDLRRSIEVILDTNIIHGDGLTGLQENGTNDPIVFSDWILDEDFITREDFLMNDMIKHEERKELNESQANNEGLFAMAGVKVVEELKPVKTYAPAHYKAIQHQDPFA